MDALTDTLASYVPALIRHRLATDPAPITAPRAERFPAAVLFADISGFTTMAERLAQRGPTGIEELTRLLNAYFGELVDLISIHGGDVVKFAGDGLIALWPATNGGETTPGLPQLSPLQLATHRAAQTGLLVQTMLHNLQVAEGVRLSCRVSIGAGRLLTVHIGGVFGRWESLITGDPLAQIGAANQEGQPGQVIASPQAWALIHDQCVGRPLPTGNAEIEDVHAPLPFHAAPPLILPPKAEAGLKAYIPAAILSRLAAGQSGWLAELRQVTVIFLNMPDLNYTTPLTQLQTVMRTLQTALYRYEGSVNKISVDDKGTTFVAALGLPPLAHEDDAVRGVRAVLAMQTELGKLGLHSAIGVTSGPAFCGSVGNKRRREYTMIGDVVNLAARLMQAASGAILCDEATYLAAKIQVTFDPLSPIAVKGKAEPVAVYRPTNGSLPPNSKIHGPGVVDLATPQDMDTQAKLTGPPSKIDMVGRTAEQTALAESIQTLLGGTSRVIVIEGEAGIGKSRLVEDLLRQAQALGVTSLIGAGDAIEKSTPYHAWRPIFGQLFKLDLVNDPPEKQRAYVLAQLAESNPDLVHLLPLLDAVLPLDFPENELTAQMSGEVRADNTHKLLVGLLKAAARTDPLLLALEDAHWLDSASWTLTWLVIREVQPVLLVVATRPLRQPLPAEYTYLLNRPDAQKLRLDMLSPAEIETLICQRLGVGSLPEPVVELIRQKAEGHPFFSEELAYALRDADLIDIVDGECRVAPGVVDLHALDFPNTIQGVITSRIDRLTPQQQFTLKVASVIGRIFAFRILRDIYPIETDKGHLADHLGALQSLDITPLETPEPDLAYIFKHIITQEVTYNLMLFAQRRRLHQAVAEWYERTYADDLISFYPILAHHWNQAEVTSKAIAYLEKAGEQALRDGANQEAVHFLSEALALDATTTDDNEPGSGQPDLLRQARWERYLGEAYFGLGDLVQSRQHLQQALARLGWSVPTTGGQLALALLRQVLRQFLHRLVPETRFLRQSHHTDILLEAAHIYTLLAEIYFFARETISIVNATLHALNLSEGAGPSPVLARAYANMCIMTGTVPLHILARAYSRRAKKTIESVNELSTQMQVSVVTTVYQLGVAQWAQADADIRQAVEIASRLGDQRRWGESLTLQATGGAYQGQFNDSLKLFNQVYEAARRSDNVLQQAWGLSGQANILVRLGQLDEAVTLAESALALLTKTADRSEEIKALAAIAVARLRQGQLQLAQEAADKVMHLIMESPPTVFSTLEGYAGAAAVYLALWETEAISDSSRPKTANQKSKISNLKSNARQACKALHRYARVFPIGQPSAWLWQGLYDWLSGHPARAWRAWQKSLTAARKLNMPYDQGWAHFEIGRHLPHQDPARSSHLNRAAEYFAQVDATYDLARVRQLSEREF